jgi:hypothetical protein
LRIELSGIPVFILGELASLPVCHDKPCGMGSEAVDPGIGYSIKNGED